MKLRQKLAVVLATAMVATAVPVVTFAASDNGMLREILKVNKDNAEFLDRTTAGGVEIKLKDAWQGKEEVFYVSLTNAEWNGDTKKAMVSELSGAPVTSVSNNTEYDIKASKIFKNFASIKDASNNPVSDVVAGTILFTEDKVARITIKDDTVLGFAKLDQTLNVPLLVKATGGDAKVKIEKAGSSSTITDGEWTFATTAEKKFTMKADDPEAVYETGKLAKVTFTENFTGAFAGKGIEGRTQGDVAWIEYELQDGDYQFDFANSKGVTGTPVQDTLADGESYTGYTLNTDLFECTYGFAGAYASQFKVTAYVKNSDKGVCVFKIEAPDNFKSGSIGKIALKDIPVRNDERDIEAGDLEVDITNFGHGKTDLLGNPTDNVKLGKITPYSTQIVMKDEKAVDVIAGRVQEITFELKENIDDSMVGDREIEIALADDLAHFNYAKGDVLYSYNYSNRTFDSKLGEKGKDNILDDQSEYKLNDTDSNKIKLVQSIKVDPDNNSKLIVKLNPKAQINGEKDKIKLKIKVCVPVANKDKEKIELKATGRGIEENKEGVKTTAINIKNPFDVTSEEMRVKVGLQNQVGGHVTIKETDKAMFMKGKMFLKVVDPSTGKTVDGIKFYTDQDSKDYVTYKAEGDIKKADLDSVVENGAATIKLNRQSKSASTLDLKDFHVTVDRTVPEGKYDLVLTGNAISEHYYETANANTKDAAVTAKEQVATYDYVANDYGSYVKVTTKATGATRYELKGYVAAKDDKGVETETVTTQRYQKELSGYTTKETKANGKKYLYTDDKQAKAHSIVVKDFFVVGTPNTEDLAANGLRRGTATFVIGESKYTANGQEFTMDAASYLQDPGFTMVPARYVAEAFGVQPKDVLFAGGKATIVAGERTIQFTAGSNIATLNGAEYKLGTKVVIKNGRTYAPIGEIANLLGVKKEWDASSKTAKFINE